MVVRLGSVVFSDHDVLIDGLVLSLLSLAQLRPDIVLSFLVILLISPPLGSFASQHYLGIRRSLLQLVNFCVTLIKEIFVISLMHVEVSQLTPQYRHLVLDLVILIECIRILKA